MSDNTQRKTSREYLADAYALAEYRKLYLSVVTEYKTLNDGHIVFLATVTLNDQVSDGTLYPLHTATGHKILRPEQRDEDFTACETMAVGRACMFLLGVTEHTIVDEEYANVLAQTITRVKNLHAENPLAAASFIDKIKDVALKSDVIQFYNTLQKVGPEVLEKENLLDAIL
jgi:hypothetical protein